GSKKAGREREGDAIVKDGNQPATERQAAASPGGLLSRSFLALLVTQFLVALNDNMFRWLIVPIGKDMIGQDRALALGAALFLLPFLIFTAPAGYLADRFSKRRVIVGCKVAEIVIMAMGIVAICSGSIQFMLAVLFLMGAQSAIFSPSKYGSIPEIVRHDRISAANGWVGMTTMFAVIFGTVAGGYLYAWTTLPTATIPGAVTLHSGQYRWWISASALIGVAVVGWVASLFIERLAPANPSRPVPWNPAAQTYRDLSALFANRPLLLAALGSVFFWSMGALAQMNIDKFARPELVVDQEYVGYLLAILTLGMGIGCVLAGFWSRGRVDVGLVPIGAAGIAVALMLLTTVPRGNGQPFSEPYLWACLWLFGLGLAAGLYDIPLLAFLQDRAPAESRGRVLAAYNFLAFSGMFLTSGLFSLLTGPLGLSARQIFLFAGVATLGVVAFLVYLIPLPLVRVLVRATFRTLYRVHIYGVENVPEKGGAILVSNHISWIDGLLMCYACPRRLHMLADAVNLQAPLIRRLSRDGGAVVFSPDDRRSIIQAVRRVRQLLHEGRLVHVFAEGGISRTGQILGFNAGFLTMMKGTGAPVIPVCSHGLWGSIFSFSGGRFFRKWPRFRRLPVTIEYGSPMDEPVHVEAVRASVQRLVARAAMRPEQEPLAPPRQLLRVCRRNARRPKAIDSRSGSISGGGLLFRALLMRRLLRRQLSPDETTIGILLPPTVDSVVVNAALSLDRRLAVNLNSSRPSEMAAGLERAGILHTITDRRLLGRLDRAHAERAICLEDLWARAGKLDRGVAWLEARIVPLSLLERLLRLSRIGIDQVFTILFDGDGESPSKGVQLTHRNIAFNGDACGETLFLRSDDIALAVAPFSTALGFATTLWSALLRDHAVALYDAAEPFDGWGTLCREHRCTILVAAPDQVRDCLEQVSAEDLQSLRLVIVAGGSLPSDLADAFESRFGVRPYASYGAAELSSIATLNVPKLPFELWHDTCRNGSVGRTLPGVAARIVDPATGLDSEVDVEGRLLFQGPNVMLGYLNQPEETQRVLRDGWFHTGDLARIDADGFLYITGRAAE
ncbi:MAG: MFS transporter, partial [Planctomycetes bacterium]|nr:MFS transporter [Planctomycetota bacterium]